MRAKKAREIIKVMGADIQPASEEALKIALKCLEIDDRLKPTDASLRLQEFEEKIKKRRKKIISIEDWSN